MISVIIPALDEAPNLARLLPEIAAGGAAAEVIVVDGGSRDGTADIARRLGARAAHGEVLLFLHADSVLPAGALGRIAEVLGRRALVVGGNFRLVFDGADAFSRRLNAFYGWMRSKGHYYGDSGIFVRRSVYQVLGGIRPMPLMEDYDFVRRLERAGPTYCIEEPPLITSSRRFEGRRAAAIVSGWLMIHALYGLGVAPARLATLYRSERA